MPRTTFTWGGSHAFRLNSTAVHEDTLRISCSYRKEESMLKLLLPTLCITYADMKFQNEIGGQQKNYPDSESYGPLYFDRPVAIKGETEIERLTYIRGAKKVTIGPRETVVEFPFWKELVIPRMRMDKKKPLDARVQVPDTPISITEPLQVDVRQFADGRHVGGIRIEKRHPDWKPPRVTQTYEGWIHVLDGPSGKPLPEMRVNILHWDEKVRTPYGMGGFRLDDSHFTDVDGNIKLTGRRSGELEAFLARAPGRRSVVRCLRPLPGQKIRLHLRCWPLQRDLRPYLWQERDSVEAIVNLCGCSSKEFLEVNHLVTGDRIEANSRVILPCWAATYRLEPWDTLEWLARRFRYSVGALAEANHTDPRKIASGGIDIKLPGWHFFFARESDTLDSLDTMFQLPKGSVITVGRCYHAWERLPFVGEVIAVPRK